MNLHFTKNPFNIVIRLSLPVVIMDINLRKSVNLTKDRQYTINFKTDNHKVPPYAIDATDE